MKGLWKVLTPFAPDQSGAVSVLYELGGILVIVDAGGCAGNVCGFDEPRWFSHKSAVFSAGLRDMDAILGRDDKLVEKLLLAAEDIDAEFAAMIGTPVPAVIATDYQALRRLAERRTGLPVLTVDSNGVELYDAGEEKAYRALFERFAVEDCPTEPGRIGVIGATPQDLSDLAAPDLLAEAFPGRTVCCYGMGAGLDEVKRAAAAEENLVVSPAGLAAAKLLQERFGTPYRVGYPPAARMLPEESYAGKKVLVVHQQVIAHALKEEFLARGAGAVTAAGWFMQKRELAQDGDVLLREEDDFTELAAAGGYDVIAADPVLKPLAKHFTGEWIDAPHFALSGKLVNG